MRLVMAAKRSFSADDIPTKSADYHGSANYIRTLPDVAARGVRSINVLISFEQALRLSLAVQSCVMNLNKYNRSDAIGREMGLRLSLKTGSKSIAVIEASVTSDEKE